MKFKNIIYLIGAFLVLIFSTLASWYEGGQLRDISWEWKYSAVFSTWLNGPVNEADDILAIDHFVYAAKFEPLFPLLMAASLLFIVFQLSAWLLRNRKTTHIIFLSLMAVGLLLMSAMLLNSPTIGLTLFSGFFGLSGLLTLVLILYRNNQKWMRRAAQRTN
ncbi:MAG: YjdJ family protein [Planococcus sp. (in: firmicutes)]|nr:YjdJ family protein [Planococcus sp. (in: firmicutes)]